MRKRNVYIVDVTRVTVPSSLEATVAKGRPFFSKKAGGWAYRSYASGVIATLNNPAISWPRVVAMSGGKGPPSSITQNSKVAGLFHRFYRGHIGKAEKLEQFEHQFNDFKLITNHLFLTQMQNELKLIYIQPRQSHCPENKLHVSYMYRYMCDYVLPAIQSLAPQSFVSHQFDWTLPLSVEIFDTGNLGRGDRFPRLYTSTDLLAVSSTDLERALEVFVKAYPEMRIPLPPKKRNSKRQPPPMPLFD